MIRIIILLLFALNAGQFQNLMSQAVIGYIKYPNRFGYQLQINPVELALPGTDRILKSGFVHKLRCERLVNIRTNVGLAFGFSTSDYYYTPNHGDGMGFNNAYTIFNGSKYIRAYSGEGRIKYNCRYIEFYTKKMLAPGTGYNDGPYISLKFGMNFVSCVMQEGFILDTYDTTDNMGNPDGFKKYKVSGNNNQNYRLLYGGLETGYILPLHKDRLWLDVSAAFNIHINYKEPINVVPLEDYLRHRTSRRILSANLITLNCGLNYAF